MSATPPSDPTSSSEPRGAPAGEGATTDSAGASTPDPGPSTVRRWLITGLAAAGVLASVAVGLLTSPPTLWGLLPIALYAVLCLLGMDIVIATVVALVSGIAVAGMSPLEVGDLLGSSLADEITVIGMVIVLGAGVGEVLKVTGVAATIVHGVMRAVGDRGRVAVTLGVMLACLVLVASLGTLAGALAIAAPILLPIAARMRFTRSATAAMMFIGGCAGLALAPFAGSNVAIMDAADVDYLHYLGYGAGPIAVLSLIVGLAVVPWMQRRTERAGDFYDEAEVGAADDSRTPVPGARRSTTVFLILLVCSVAYATWSNAGTTFPLLALPLLGFATGFAGRLDALAIASHIYRGGARLLHILLLFWLLAGLFILIDKLEPFQVILDTWGPGLADSSPFVFTIAIALLGWVGVPGATAAQVVLLDKVFGDLAGSIGVGTGAWVVVLLFASKADTYGPFPNGNMVGAMGLARSSSLRNMLITGWLLLIPACAMYTAILYLTAG